MTIENPSDPYLDLLKQCLCASLYEESGWQRVSKSRFQDSSVSSRLKRSILKMLRKRDLMLVWAKPFDPVTRQIGSDWPLFGFTMTGRYRLDALQRIVERIVRERIPGDFIETGVWRGGSVILMRALLKEHGVTDRTVWCADSFEGMPVPAASDEKFKGDPNLSDEDHLAVSVEDVRRNFAKFGLLDDQVKFLKGWFSDSLPKAPIERLALIRLDGDHYSSTMDALTSLYPKLVQGGHVIVDDYNSWAGCKAAVDEYRARHGIVDPLERIDGHSVWWRRSAGAASEGSDESEVQHAVREPG